MPVTEVGLVRYGPFLYRVPVRLTQQYETLIAINAGGALIPLLVSLYLLSRFDQAIPLAAAATLVVAGLVNRSAVPVEDLGVVIRGFWPPLITVFGRSRAVGQLLAGARDPLRSGLRRRHTRDAHRRRSTEPACHLETRHRNRQHRRRGPFDGIFLTGVVAVLLT